MALTLVFVLAIAIVALVCGQTYPEGKINVHLITHTHTDPGWLKTADQYYYGSNNTIYSAGVQYILDSVVESLLADPARKFVYVEMSFFQRWYFEQTEKMKEAVRFLVKNGQLTFANGGWVMHDEAGSHFMSMIDQTTLGHRFLKDEFGYTPRVGWQIDPFGHSNTQASLLSSEVGFDSLFFGRIDYADINIRKNTKTLEFIWRGSESQQYNEVFTGVFSDGNYGFPKGFCFDDNCYGEIDPPVMDDLRLEDNNVDDIVTRFVAAIEKELSYTNGKHMSLRMGADFNYQNANKWFRNLDKIIRLVNERDPRYNVLYSTPEQYTRAKGEEGLTWTEKTDDFFPYADSPHAYWAGYFTSRPALKYIERISSSFLQTVKQSTVRAPNKASLGAKGPMAVAAAAGVNNGLRGTVATTAVPNAMTTTVAHNSHHFAADPHENAVGHVDPTSTPWGSLLSLTQAVGLVNHHDAITGTSKQHVADDYMKIIDKALTKAEEVTSKVVARDIFVTEDATKIPEMKICRMMNETRCDVTQGLQVGQEALIVAYNPLPRSRSQQLQIILNGDVVVAKGVRVEVYLKEATRLSPIEAELVPPVITAANGQMSAGNPYTLVFTASQVPPLSSSNYLVKIASGVNPLVPAAKVLEAKVWNEDDGAVIGTNGVVSMKVCPKTGLLKTITRKVPNAQGGMDEISLDVSNDLAYYRGFGYDLGPFNGEDDNRRRSLTRMDTRDPHLQNISPHESLTSSDADRSAQASGAYIFRTSTLNEIPSEIRNSADRIKVGTPAATAARVAISVVQGKQIVEIRQTFSQWAVCTLRIRAAPDRDASAQDDEWNVIESEWTVGPIPIDDGWGKEVIATYTTDLATNGHIFTDSNGREFMDRVKNYRPTYELDVTEPIAGNYYPITAAAYIKDETRGLTFSVLTDRSQGVASLKDGQMEFLVHRRLLLDDWRGVNEALNETTGGITPYPMWTRIGDGLTITGTHYLLLSPIKTGVRDTRSWMDKAYLPMVPFVGVHDNEQQQQHVVMKDHRDAVMAGELPANLQLLTLERWSFNTVLARVAHRFAVNEDEELSKPVDVDLAKLFAPLGVVSVEEKSLSANQDRAQMLRDKIRWKGPSSDKVNQGIDEAIANTLQPGSTKVTIKPMEVRTFLITVSTH